MRDDDATVHGLGPDEVVEIMQSENTCPCAFNPRARHTPWCANRENGVCGYHPQSGANTNLFDPDEEHDADRWEGAGW